MPASQQIIRMQLRHVSLHGVAAARRLKIEDVRGSETHLVNEHQVCPLLRITTLPEILQLHVGRQLPIHGEGSVGAGAQRAL